MADNRLNKTGLKYFYDRLKTIFATKTEVSTLSSRLDDVVSEGGEPNKIDVVKVNGEELTITDKAVDVPVPVVSVSDGTTMLAGGSIEWENDGLFTVQDESITEEGTLAVGFSEPLVSGQSRKSFSATIPTVDYVKQNGGKIDTIKVNGTEQTITDKAVDITIPSEVFVATKDVTTYEELKDAIEANKTIVVDEGAIIFPATAYRISTENAPIMLSGTHTLLDVTDILAYGVTSDNKWESFDTSGSIASMSDVINAINTAIGDITSIDYQVVTELPSTGEKGVIYLLSNSGSAPNVYDEYIYTNDAFEKIGTTDVDLDGYFNETNLTAITTAEIDEIIEGA